MSRISSLLLAVTTGLCAIALDAWSTKVADFYDSYAGESGIDSNVLALNRVTSCFAHQVCKMPNLPEVAITDFQRIKNSIATRLQTKDTKSTAPIEALR